MGGLGNQLFQIFTVLSYSIISKNNFKFTNAKTLGEGETTVRNTYWDSFLYKLKPFTRDEFPELHLIMEKNYRFKELPIHEMVNKNILLFGYFQSYKYFESNYNLIYRILCIEDIKNNLLKKMNYVKNDFNKTISLHFRIGDYKLIQNCHPIMKKEYYYKSIKHIVSKMGSNNNLKVLYFCEDVDFLEAEEKIQYLSEIFPFILFERADNKLEDWEQLILMSLCNYNIVANSSFSWWGAYLNSWENKIVCYPSKWFGEDIKHDTSDLCPLEWNKIKI
jgi:hypothetical protein